MPAIDGWPVTPPIEPHRRRPRLRVIALAVLVALAAGTWWTLLRAGEPFAPGTRSMSANGITLSYPSGWIVHDQGWASTGLGSTFAILGTQPWGLCLPFDINCHEEAKLEPNQISVELGRGILGGESICDIGVDRHDLAGRGPGDPPATGHLVRVDGRPTLQTDYEVNRADYYLSDAWRVWIIAAPGSTTTIYRIDTKYRGPEIDRFHQQLDDLVASVRFTGGPVDGVGEPDDCGAPFP
jgi:hypothetical protein